MDYWRLKFCLLFFKCAAFIVSRSTLSWLTELNPLMSLPHWQRGPCSWESIEVGWGKVGHRCVNRKRRVVFKLCFHKRGQFHDGYWDLFFEHGHLNFRLCFYLCLCFNLSSDPKRIILQWPWIVPDQWRTRLPIYGFLQH